MSGRIIVAVKGGDRSDAALAWGIHWAKALGTSLEVCTVLDRDVDSKDYGVLRDSHQRVLDASRAKVAAEAPHLASSYVLHRGKLLDVLAAVGNHSDLLVVGSRKSAFVEGIVHGTLALKLAERIATALVVVPEGWTDNGGSIVGGVDDESDRDALTFASLAAVATSRTLILVHAIQQPVYYSPYDFGVRVEILDEQKEFGERTVADRCAHLRSLDRTLRVDGRVIIGTPSLVMVRSAANASLAVVGTHARGVMQGILFGSVGRDLLMNMPCPVAIVPFASPASTGDAVVRTSSMVAQ